MSVTPIVLAATALVALLLAIRRWRGLGRQRAMTRVLDAADALEARLRTARAEIEAIAGSDRNPVRDALAEMLRQRLWLKQHGDQAAVAQLQAVADSIDAARERIDQQLLQIQRARIAPLPSQRAPTPRQPRRSP